MSGAKYLIDSNILIGVVNGHAPALAALETQSITPDQCAYSSITSMELLGWRGITQAQEMAILALINTMHCLPITEAVERATITLRRSHKIKLPDAIIAATAQVSNLHLITLDQELLAIAVDQTVWAG